MDVYSLEQYAVRRLVALLTRTYHLCRLYTSLPLEFDQQVAEFDLQCICGRSRHLSTNLYTPSTLKHLVTITQFTNFDPTLPTYCFNIFIGCINSSDGKVVITQELEELTTESTTCFLHTFCHLSATRPTSSVLVDLRKCYNRVFPL
jgi:hypothetical protein